MQIEEGTLLGWRNSDSKFNFGGVTKLMLTGFVTVNKSQGLGDVGEKGSEGVM